jgi:hypothetical protein
MAPENGNAGYLLGAGPFPVPPEVFPGDLQSQQAPHQGGALNAGGGGAAGPVPGTPREELSAEDNQTNPGTVAPVGGVRDASAAAEDAAAPESGEKAVSDMNRAELEAELRSENVPAEGSGSGQDGNVVVDDLREALSAQRESDQ